MDFPYSGKVYKFGKLICDKGKMYDMQYDKILKDNLMYYIFT